MIDMLRLAHGDRHGERPARDELRVHVGAHVAMHPDRSPAEGAQLFVERFECRNLMAVAEEETVAESIGGMNARRVVVQQALCARAQQAPRFLSCMAETWILRRGTRVGFGRLHWAPKLAPTPFADVGGRLDDYGLD